MEIKQLKKLVVSGALALSATANLLAVSLPVSAGQQLGQTDFENGVGLPWHVCESLTGKMDFEIDNGVYTITIVNPGGASNGGEDRWDCQFRHRGLHLVSGATYTVSFDITASNSCSYYTKIGDMGEPYTEDWHGEPDGSQFDSYWDVKWLSANQKTTVTATFTAKREADVEWAFHIGGDSVPAGTVFTFDNMSLISSDSQYDYVAQENWQRSDILTNQVGYFEQMSKKATLLSNASSGINFSLKDASGAEVYSGTSTVIGNDADSGDAVHVLDFSEYTTAGTYTLATADGAVSREFSIGGGELYSYMLYDSLNYFYQNRSGVPIDSQYIISGDGNSLSRPAGHTSDVATIEQTWGYSGSSGTQDVTGGWYDAGDHGKYVVNGGIAAWTMQNQYEYALKHADASVFGDGSMSIPENGNGYPDLLDEARFEIEWFMKMLVQNGEYAGMVYHKVHDEKWTALALSPADDTEKRIIKPPTTCATLNVSATCAQAARLWKEIDPAFADQCLNTAKTTYEAAKKHPNMFAPLDESIGGGAYGDDDATDEFYWAACELYATTGDSTYLSDMKASSFYLSVATSLGGGESVDTVGTMDWGNTATLGSLTLYLNSDSLGGDADTLKSNLTKAGDYFANLSAGQGYGQPYGQSTLSYNDSTTGYIWGSNSFVVNNGIVLAYAFTESGNAAHLSGAVSAMDYILGRNPNDYSYVTGYGSHAVAYPHHRWWSGQIDDAFPLAPNGVLVGGPNSGMQDPWVKGSGWKKGAISPAKCYLDHVEAWSVNECTINWNAPLSWLTGFLADEAGGITVTHGSADGNANSGESSDSNSAAGNADSNGTSSGSNVNNNNTNTNNGANNSGSNQTNGSVSGDSEKKNSMTIWIIAGAILIALISIEIFVYKMMKMSKAQPVVQPQQQNIPVQNPAPMPQNPVAAPQPVELPKEQTIDNKDDQTPCV
ncbi:MAG: glycoside hydrolase family 9 protein [Ruminococcus sp.]|nr:glycoside hydrolase family 9 protein [Ruminococcus sp.]